MSLAKEHSTWIGLLLLLIDDLVELLPGAVHSLVEILGGLLCVWMEVGAAVSFVAAEEVVRVGVDVLPQTFACFLTAVSSVILIPSKSVPVTYVNLLERVFGLICCLLPGLH